MPRDHAQLRLDIWSDDDFRTLSCEAQHLYFMLLTHPNLSYCGVVDWRPARLAGMVGDWTVEVVERAAGELIERLYVVVDARTEEVLVRSFVRHDGLMKMPKMATAMASAHAAVGSVPIRQVVVWELQRLHREEPDLKGWGSEKASAVLAKPSVDPSTYPCGNPSGNPKPRGSGNPSANPPGNPPLSPAPTPAPTPRDKTSSSLSTDAADAAPEPDPFNDFWSAYPRKTSKPAARRAWTSALKKADRDTIMAGLERFAFSPDPQFQPHPATWLNQERWADVPARPGQHLRVATAGGQRKWTGAELTDVLGPDRWNLPQPPAGMGPDERWEWERKLRVDHIADRVRQAEAKLSGAATGS